MTGMESFTWNKGEENVSVNTYQDGDGLSLSVTVGAHFEEDGVNVEFFAVGVVGVTDPFEQILDRAQVFSLPGTPGSGCFAACGDLLDGPSLSAFKDVVFTVTGRSI